MAIRCYFILFLSLFSTHYMTDNSGMFVVGQQSYAETSTDEGQQITALVTTHLGGVRCFFTYTLQYVHMIFLKD